MVRPRFSAATRSLSLSDWRTARAAIWVYLLNLPRTPSVNGRYRSEKAATNVKTLRQLALLMVVDGLGLEWRASVDAALSARTECRRAPGITCSVLPPSRRLCAHWRATLTLPHSAVSLQRAPTSIWPALPTLLVSLHLCELSSALYLVT